MGKLIVIDGLDGSGKNTQTKIIYAKLEELGYKVRMVSFPDYKSLAGQICKEYLSGEYGTGENQPNGYLSSLFYTVDRAISFKKEMQKLYDEDYILLADRYLSSNIIFQGSKFATDEEKQEYFKWEYNLETTLVGLPVEDITIILDVSIEASQKLMSLRYKGDESQKDLHESNIPFLRECKNTLNLACDYLPEIGYNWVRIDCNAEDFGIKPVEQITDTLMDYIMPIIKDCPTQK